MTVVKLALLLLATTASGLNFDSTDAKNRPVTKVVTLLKDMSAQLEKEGEEDEEVYDKMVCWCETNDKEKTAAIAYGEQHSTELEAFIQEMASLSSRLTTEISTLSSEVATNTNGLDKATGLREKELAEFTSSEAESLASIKSLGSAVDTMAKHNSLAQTDSEVVDMQVNLKRTLKRHSSRIGEMLMPSQRKVLNAFVQAPEDYMGSFAQQSGPQNAGSYAPQSGAIFGVLKNMKETFEANLAAAQKEESESQKAYQELKAAKESEIAAGTKQIEKKTAQMSEADEKKAQAMQDLTDTTNTLAADRDFLAKLKEHCNIVDKEMEMRSKTRAEEIGAVSKALAILTNDDAHDLFTKTLGFVQRDSSVKSKTRDAVVKILSHNPKLAAVAVQARLSNFGKVKETLEKMITDLTKEKEDEIALKDWCNDEIRKNERNTEMTDRKKEGQWSHIEDLTSTIDTLTKEIDGLNGQIAEMQVEMKRAGEDREMENRAFQQTIADQQATAALLTKALNVLQGFYGKKASLIQTSGSKQPAGPPPPPGFKSYKNNKQSGGVMGMIQQIINDADAMEKEALKDELAAQQGYEDIVKETNNAILTCRNSIMNKADAKAKAEGDKTETEVALDTTMDQLSSLAAENMDLHGQCDFTTKNFDARQSSRDDEVEALKQSVAILSGAQMGGFLQASA